MEEDVLGTMRTVSKPVVYMKCARCGKMTPQADAVVVPADALSTHSEYEHLCASCYAALEDGEQDLSVTEP
jgi:hypothetical protein